MRAIQVTEFGGPEVLTLADVPEPEAADGMIPVEVTLAGINYADTHHAENTYLSPAKVPLIPGAEVVGLTPDGRRVVGLLPEGGGYAERALLPPITTVDMPEGVDDAQALAIILQGATAWHLLRTSTHMQPGETVLVHAGAGGVGSLAIQLAKRWGAGKVVATASSENKRALASELGADVTLDSAAAEDPDAIHEAAGGPVDVALEMVGGPTFDASLAALGPFGRVAVYGMASRVPPTPVNPPELIGSTRGVIGFWLAHCLTGEEMFRPQVEELLGMVAAGELRVILGGTYPLGDARRAHEDLRARRTAGKLVLDPRA
jgi:NADPH2:quinone reductase